MRRGLRWVAAGALLCPPLAVPAEAAYTTSATYVASADGTPLHTVVFRPSGAKGRLPVVLLVSPYLDGSTRPAYEPEFPALLKRGYAVVQVALRGYGASGGCGDFGGPGEQADAKAAVEWAAAQPWSTGRVGMWGISYDGWTQVMALATRPRGLAAAVVQSPLASAYRGLYMNGAHYGEGWWTTPAKYAAFDLLPPAGSTGNDGLRTALTGTALGGRCYAENAAFTAAGDRTLAYWRERDLVARAATSAVPVLWSHGFADVNTKPDNLSAVYPRLRGPKRAWVGQYPHDLPGDDGNGPSALRAAYLAEAFDWLDAYVKRDPKALRRVGSGAVVQDAGGGWRRDGAWPPRDASPATFALRSGTYVDVVGNDGALHDRGEVLWTFSQPLPYAVHLSGTPRVTLGARGAGPAQVVVKVFDLDELGAARLVTRGVHAGVSGTVSFDLYPQDWRFEPGHRIAVAVLGSDGAFWSHAVSGAVQVDDARLTVPALRYDRAGAPRLGRTEPVFAGAALRPSAAAIRAGATTFRLPPRMKRR